MIDPRQPTATFVSGAELARRMGVSYMTVKRWREKKIIVGYRMGRNWFFDPEEVEQSIKRSTR